MVSHDCLDDVEKKRTLWFLKGLGEEEAGVGEG